MTTYLTYRVDSGFLLKILPRVPKPDKISYFCKSFDTFGRLKNHYEKIFKECFKVGDDEFLEFECTDKSFIITSEIVEWCNTNHIHIK